MVAGNRNQAVWLPCSTPSPLPGWPQFSIWNQDGIGKALARGMIPASQESIALQGHPKLAHKERVGRERSPGGLFLWTIGVTPLRVFQRGHAPTTVDPLPSCCKQGSPEGMLEQESAVQVEGGKGRVHCIVVGSRPYKEPGAAVARPHLPLQFHLGVLHLGLCPAKVCRDL